MNFVNRKPDFDCEWRRAYVTVLAKPWATYDLLTSEQVFLIMSELVARYEIKYRFVLAEVKNLFRSMKEMSFESQEMKMWQCALEDSLAGKKVEWVRNHYFLDWHEK